MAQTHRRHSARIGIVVGLAVGLLGTQASKAWLFGGKDKGGPEVVMPPAKSGEKASPAKDAAPVGTRVVARAHMRFDDPTEEKKLMMYIDARRRSQEDYAVITRLIQEKQLEVKTFNDQMQAEFGVDPARNYQYEADKSTIYELTPKADLTDEQKSKPVATASDVTTLYDLKEFRKLTSDEEKNRFMRLASSKQLALEQISMLTLLQNEKEIETDTLHQEMVRLYAISTDREYRYDDETKTLFELVTVPADYVEPKAAPGDSKAKKR